jgi:Lon protease-like protein
MGERVEHFPLFPLELVALPHELIPLHIFEERYRVMVARCLEERREFGIVWASEDGVRTTGCACTIEKVLHEHDDGRLDILARGTRPLRVLGDLDAVPYPAAHVELLDEPSDPADPATEEAAHAAYGDLVREVTDEEPESERLAAMDAYAMAATVELGLDAKQGLLDMRSEDARLRLVTRLFRAAVHRMDMVDRAQARAASNGKVRFG